MKLLIRGVVTGTLIAALHITSLTPSSRKPAIARSGVEWATRATLRPRWACRYLLTQEQVEGITHFWNIEHLFTNIRVKEITPPFALTMVTAFFTASTYGMKTGMNP